MGGIAGHGNRHAGDAGMKRKTLAVFETVHGAPKIKALERRLAEERALAGLLAKIRAEG
jgi:hypothetical protein